MHWRIDPPEIDSPVLAGMLKALGNENRLSIFTRLAACCPPGTLCNAGDTVPACVGDLGQDMDIAPSTLSHHLKELSTAGLITMKRDGKQVRCAISAEAIATLAAFFGRLGGGK